MRSDSTRYQQANVLLEKDVMRAFPKVELHRHLEGTFSLPTLFEMAKRNKLDLPRSFDDFKKAVQFPKDSDPDFLKFLSKFKNNWYRSLDDVYEITYRSVREFAEDGIFYIELRFSPEHFAAHNDFDRTDVTKLIVEAGQRAATETGITVTYLITFTRNKQPQDQMIELYRLVRDLDIEQVVGMDLAGDELNYPGALFQKFFDIVHSDGIYNATIHAGEVTPPSEIWDAIDKLHARRIGHGTSAIQDEALQEALKERHIVLEQCITSNYQTGSWSDEQNHPLGRLLRLGVPVTVNSDDPFIQDTDLTDDYMKCVRYFDFSVDDLVTSNLNAIGGLFLRDEAQRDRIKADYLAAVREFRSRHKV